MTVIALTLAAAALCALSSAAEHRAAQDVARRPRQTRRRSISRFFDSAHRLVTTPLWMAGLALDVAAFFLEAAALHLGSVSVVEPLMTAALLFTLPLAAAEYHQRPSVRDWAAASAVSAGLALVLATHRVPDGTQERPTPLLVPASLAVIVIAVVLVVLARGRSPSVRAGLLGRQRERCSASVPRRPSSARRSRSAAGCTGC